MGTRPNLVHQVFAAKYGDDPLYHHHKPLTADEWTEFLQMDLSNSVTNERAVVFLAESLTFLGTSHEDTENLRLERLHFSKLYNQVLNGSITDSISVAGQCDPY